MSCIGYNCSSILDQDIGSLLVGDSVGCFRALSFTQVHCTYTHMHIYMHVYNSHDAYIYTVQVYKETMYSWNLLGCMWAGVLRRHRQLGWNSRPVGGRRRCRDFFLDVHGHVRCTHIPASFLSLYIYMYHTYIYIFIYACAFFYKGYMFEKQTYNMWNNLGSPKLTALSSLRCLAAFHCGRGRNFLHQLLGVLGWLTYVWIVGSILCIHHQVIKRGN